MGPRKNPSILEMPCLAKDLSKSKVIGSLFLKATMAKLLYCLSNFNHKLFLFFSDRFILWVKISN